MASARGNAVGDFFPIGGPVGFGGVGGLSVQFFRRATGCRKNVKAGAAALIGNEDDFGSIGGPGGGAVGATGIGEAGWFATGRWDCTDFGVAELGKAEGQSGAVGRESRTRVLARELGDAGTFFCVQVDYVGIAVAAFIRAIGDLRSVWGEFWSIAKGAVLGELAGVGPVDV